MACETLIKSNLWGDNVDAVGVNILSGERSHRSHATHSHSLAMPWWEDSKAQWAHTAAAAAAVAVARRGASAVMRCVGSSHRTLARRDLFVAASPFSFLLDLWRQLGEPLSRWQ